MTKHSYSVTITVFDIEKGVNVRTCTRDYFYTSQRLMVGESVLIGKENPIPLKVTNITHKEVVKKIWPLSLWIRKEALLSLTVKINNGEILPVIDLLMLNDGFTVVKC